MKSNSEQSREKSIQKVQNPEGLRFIEFKA